MRRLRWLLQKSSEPPGSAANLLTQPSIVIYDPEKRPCKGFVHVSSFTLTYNMSSIRQTVIQRAVWAAILLGVMAFGLVFPFPFEGRPSGEVFDLAHGPVFCLVLICGVAFLDPSAAGLSTRWTVILPMSFFRVLVVALGLTFVGLAGEFLQKYSGRNASWSDVAANTIGLLAGVLWIRSRAVTGPVRTGLVTAAVMAIVLISVRPTQNLIDCYQQYRSFPQLASFERRRELGSFHGTKAALRRSEDWSTDGAWSLKMQLRPARFSGAAMIWFPRDWSHTSALQLDLYNPEEDRVTVFVKVFDHQHTTTGYNHRDRFLRSFVVEAGGSQSVRIDMHDILTAPEGRRMDLKNVWALEIYVADVSSPQVLYVDHLRLAP